MMLIIFHLHQDTLSSFLCRVSFLEKDSEYKHNIEYLRHENEVLKQRLNNIKKDNVKIDFFKENKDLFKYYGRDIEILVMKTTISHSKRVLCLDEEEKTILTNKDIDNGLELFKKHLDEKKEDDSRIIFAMYN